jgi:bifunctional DNA-binding transcriptional regulator/antitoxin component of YhaV-PrlF toxin-antitoxin module
MTQTKIMDDGRMTLPLEVRDWLQLTGGGKIAFIRDDSGVRMVNAALLAIDEIQKAMAGEAEHSGLDSDEKIVDYCKEVRRELYEERYARHD